MIDPGQYKRVRELFLAAVKLNGSERSAYLENECGQDRALRDQVNALLANDAEPAHLVESAGVARVLSDEPSFPAMDTGANIPKTIGSYTVKRLIGTGGMGAVYEAEQDQPRRAVALKVIRPGVMSHEVRRRFKHEAQLLGRLQHPGIAQIYDADLGDVDAGRQPFFVMEYVSGAPLIHFAADRRMSIPDRLKLLTRVCDAVQHAHQKGVIHRDLKPDNILVTKEGRPKVLDFGIARTTDSDLQVTTLRTSAGQIIGTLQYMSPEQAAGQTQAIDTRTDIYALGMIGYELVFDRTPYDLRGSSVADAIRTITEFEPTRLSRSHRMGRSDIETIFLKALQKDPEQRYASVEQFSADIRRYLADEPIVARPPSTLYQLRKFAKRNKPIVIGTALALFSLLAGFVVSVDQALRAADARDAEIVARNEAESSRDVAQREALKAQAINRFLLQDMIASVDPGALGRDVTVAEVLANASAQIGTAFAEQPEVEAAVRLAIGELYLSLGKYDDADPLLTTAVALFDKHDDTRLHWADGMLRIANLRRETGDYDAAEAANRAVLDAVQLQYDNGRADAEELAKAMTGLGQSLHLKGDLIAAMDLHQRALAIRREQFGTHHLATAESLGNVGDLYEAQGEFEEAAPFLQESLDIRRDLLGAKHPAVAMAANNLGVVYYRIGQHSNAEPLLREALDVRRELYGEGHLRSLVSLANLGSCIKAQGRLDEAEALYRETLRLKIEHLGRNHQSVARSMQNLGVLLRDQKKFEEATRLLLDAIAIREELLGTDHPSVAISLIHLGTLHNVREEFVLAEPVFRRALAIQEKKLPEGNWWIARTRIGLGTCLMGQGRLGEAEPLLLAAREGLTESLGASHSLSKSAVSRLVQLYETWQKPERAENWRALHKAAAGHQ